MKNTNTKVNVLLILCFCLINVKCQTIVDMASNEPHPDNLRKNRLYYIKDVNNNLDKFVGTWEYVSGNEKFQINLTKVTKDHIVYSDTQNSNYNNNYYEDGIKYQYKKFVNNILTYTSPLESHSSFESSNGILLNGNIRDYGRIAKTVYLIPSQEVMYQGGGPVSANCEITKLSTNTIKFHLYLRHEYPNYDEQTYAGQPLFSLPNNVIMTKVP